VAFTTRSTWAGGDAGYIANAGAARAEQCGSLGTSGRTVDDHNLVDPYPSERIDNRPRRTAGPEHRHGHAGWLNTGFAQ